jgi:formylglycine-generating enzyme required for sulfatase activity
MTILVSLQDAAARLGNNPAAPLWLADLLPAEIAAGITQSAWLRNSMADFPETSSGVIDLPFRIPGSLTLEGVVFTAVSPGYLEKYGQRESLPPLLIAQSPVSLDAWNAFTAENPQWSADNRESLIARGLVGDDYLVPVNHSAYPAPAASGISWYAAAAYCTWLGAKLPEILPGWELRLPFETEWEFAVRQKELNPGMLWEWCADLWAPLDFFPAKEEALAVLEKAATAGIAVVSPPDRVVRGGSWFNPPGTTGIETRGSLPPELSSPFVGFRPVIVPKRGN